MKFIAVPPASKSRAVGYDIEQDQIYRISLRLIGGGI